VFVVVVVVVVVVAAAVVVIHFIHSIRTHNGMCNFKVDGIHPVLPLH
jgi:hypothetical protein